MRSGDSLGSIGATFGIQAEDIARANRLQLDSTLEVIPKERLDGRLSTKQSDQLNEQMMQASKLTAT
ncbi:MAG: LysM peptidoglycan-binding domain-containing protein [Candidatus Binataceae bacterium]